MDNQQDSKLEKKQVNLVIADDHAVIAAGLVALLKQTPNLNILGKASDGQKLIELLYDLKRKGQPANMVLLDIEMPNMDGVKTAAILKKDMPDLKILILTMYSTPEFIKSLYHCGVDGYLLKRSDYEDLTFAIKTVMEGKRYFPPEIVAALIDKPTVSTPIDDLTEREKNIIKMICSGLTTKEISVKIDRSENTVEKYRASIFQKLKVKNMAELGKFATQNGLCN